MERKKFLGQCLGDWWFGRLVQVGGADGERMVLLGVVMDRF